MGYNIIRHDKFVAIQDRDASAIAAGTSYRVSLPRNGDALCVPSLGRTPTQVNFTWDEHRKLDIDISDVYLATSSTSTPVQYNGNRDDLIALLNNEYLNLPSSSTTPQTPMTGQVTQYAGATAPNGWTFCDGSMLDPSVETALFAVIGTTYGGDGISNFALPDFRGRSAIGSGQGASLSSFSLGDSGGAESVTLTTAQMPSHSHNLRADSASGTVIGPAGHALANCQTFDNDFSENPTNVSMSADSIQDTGGGQSHENRSPYLAINYIIAL